MDLVLNNPQRLICHKTQTNKQTNRSPRSIVPEVLDCSFEVSEIELQFWYHVYLRTNTFRKVINPLMPAVMDWWYFCIICLHNSLYIHDWISYYITLGNNIKHHKVNDFWLRFRKNHITSDITEPVKITLGNNFLLFECCLDFYNWFRVFLHYWIRKRHPFLSIRSGFFASLIWKESDLLTKSITFLWHYQLIFVNSYHSKYVFKRKNVLPTTYIDYLIETSITVNWMVGIDKGKYT